MPHLALFVVAVVILGITPGPAVLYIVTRSVMQGRRAGLASCFGLAAGTLVHVLAVILGLAALLAASARAFTLIKYAGALYLIWLGVRQLSDRTPPGINELAQQVSHVHAFRDGVVVNLLNVSAAAFLVTFLPQFVEPARGSVPFQVGVLGATFLLIGLSINLAWCFAASAARGWLLQQPRFAASQRFVAATVYCGLGLATAMTGTK